MRSVRLIIILFSRSNLLLIRMEELVKNCLNVTYAKSIETPNVSDNCVGYTFETDKGKFFVKANDKYEAIQMFEGEIVSLDAIQETNTIRVPKWERVVENKKDGGAVLIMEHLNIGKLEQYQALLGRQLARMHMHNADLGRQKAQRDGRVGCEETEYVNKFGFHSITCCGYLPLNNEWRNNWLDFYAQQRLKIQLDMIEMKYSDRDVMELWSKLQRKLPGFFKNIHVNPALLHGDLWSGNAGDTDSGPVIFDPGSYYGHSEFDLAIARMYDGFSESFFSAYHELIPKAPGFESRHQLYLLFHHLNHWNHFGSKYRTGVLSIMRTLVKS